MKKKFSLWLNIVTICLCICAIAIGVYAATNASITVSGQIGFKAHDCKVNVTGYIYGHAQGSTLEQVKHGLPTPEPTQGQASTYVYLTENNTPLEVSGDADTLSLGENRFFSDMASTDPNGKPDDIYVVLEISNASEHYQVQADVSNAEQTFGKIKMSVVGESTQVMSETGTATFTFKFELLPEADGKTYASIQSDSLQNVSIGMTFEKYVERTTPGNNVSINFNAKDAEVAVSATKVGYSTGENSYEDNIQSIVSNNTITGDANGTSTTINAGKLYFADTQEAQPIELSLSATNKSETLVAAMIYIENITDARYTIQYELSSKTSTSEKQDYKEAVILDSEQTIIFYITLTPISYAEIRTNDLQIETKFTNYVPANISTEFMDTEQGLLYTLNENKTGWSVRGGYPDYTNSIIGTFVEYLKKTDIVITPEIHGLPVTEIADFAFGYDENGSSLTSIVMPNTITKIGQYAFSKSQVQKVVMSDSITALDNSHSFYYCSYLHNLKLSSNLTSIGSYVFANCSNLKCIIIPESVTDMVNTAFDLCLNVIYIVCSENLQNNTAIQWVISDNGYSLKGVVDHKNSKLKIDKNGFVILNESETSKVLVNYYGDDKELVLPNDITGIGINCFYYNQKITSITIGQNVATIGNGAFSECKNLSTVINRSGLNIVAGSSDFGGVAKYATEVINQQA